MNIKHLIRSLTGTELRGKERTFGEQLSDRRYAEQLFIRGQAQLAAQEQLAAEQAELERQRQTLADEQRRIEQERQRLEVERQVAEETARRLQAAPPAPGAQAPSSVTPELVAQVMLALAAQGALPQTQASVPEATPRSAAAPQPAAPWEYEQIPDEALDDTLMSGQDDLHLWDEPGPPPLPVAQMTQAETQDAPAAPAVSESFEARMEETERKMSAIAAIDAMELPDFEDAELPSATDVMLAQLRAAGHATIREGCARGRRVARSTETLN